MCVHVIKRVCSGMDGEDWHGMLRKDSAMQVSWHGDMNVVSVNWMKGYEGVIQVWMIKMRNYTMDIRTHEMLVLPLHLRQRTGDLSTHPIGGPPSVLTTDRRTTNMTVVYY